MKISTMKTRINFKTRHLLLLLPTWLLSWNLSCLEASETTTNWNWLNLTLNISNTNLVVGSNILTSIVVSNRTESPHTVYYWSADPCFCGPGNFEITNLETARKVEYAYSEQQRAGLMQTDFTQIQGHHSMQFDCNLAAGYTMTNQGMYSVRAVCWFPAYKPLTNHQYVTVLTPPVLIPLSPK